MIGTTLAHYKITYKLGHGGMGEVYLAEDTRLKRKVALKVLSTDLAGDPDRLARFQREAETVAGLNHPNIVTLYSVESEDDVHFITMELVEGKTLDQVIPSGGLSLNKVFELATPFADALSAAHEKGIIHRDLKPANVMVNDEGRIKVLDFGLAKPLEEKASEQEATQLMTEEGKILGTIPYMAPEQVQGKPLDRRSDIFSMGVMLYEMVTGSRPFQGETSADLISTILRDDPVPVTEFNLELPHHLGRIIRHCLEKDPKRRYQSALDVRNELEGLRKEVEAGAVSTQSGIREASLASESAAPPSSAVSATVEGADPAAPFSRKWIVQAAGAALIVAVVLLTIKLVGKPGERVASGAPASAPVAVESDQPSVAVMFFDNLSGDPELDWLRNGLTDMLVTDLSQSPDLRVLSTNRIYQILSDMKKLDERITSFEVIREVAEEAAADTVILGSFAKLGETIRISITIQEAQTGEILKSDSVDANAQEDIFDRIDDLSRNIRQSIELPAKPAAVADRDLAEVSTQSVEAYRHYVEAERLHYESRDFEAIEFYRKAVEADPEFAMAWAKLSTAHGNTGRQAEALEYAEKAIEHLDRLTEPERAYVEGKYFGRSLATYNRAIETYTSTLARYPHLTSLTNNLAVLYSGVWMYDEAIAMFEQGIAHGDRFPGTYSGLAGAYLAKGETEKAFRVLDGFAESDPTTFSTYVNRAGLFLTVGDTERAKADVAKAEELQPGYFALEFTRYTIGVLEKDWKQAEAAIQKLRALPFPFAKSASLGLEINLLFYRGRMAEGRSRVQPAIDAWGGPSVQRASVLMQSAMGFYLSGDPERALALAGQARAEGRDSLADYIANGVQTLAQQGLGQERLADLTLEELTQRIEPLPGTGLEFWLREVRGRLALARGNAVEGLAELEAAESMLPAVDQNTPRVWFDLGEAHRAAGRNREAESWYRRLIDLHAVRVFSGTQYVMSHLRLAQIAEQSGDAEAARGHYQTFLDYWGDGDTEREQVAHARAFLARSL
ncbi:MAG: protein kinase [Thermoanaerobaculia bacterium]